jgi:hypothetical protein
MSNEPRPMTASTESNDRACGATVDVERTEPMTASTESNDRACGATVHLEQATHAPNRARAVATKENRT